MAADRGDRPRRSAGTTATTATGAPTASTTPTATSWSLCWESERYVAPDHLQPVAAQPAAALHGARRGGQAPRPRQPARHRRPPPAASSPPTCSATATTRASGSTTASETGAWLSLTIAAHELIYVRDARGAGGRLHHLAFWVDTREECLRAADIFLEHDVHIEAAPSRTRSRQGFFLYCFEPGGNRIEVTTGGYFVYEPDAEPVIWTEAERAKGQAWGVKTVDSFHYYGTPPTAEDREYALAAGVAAP